MLANLPMPLLTHPAEDRVLNERHLPIAAPCNALAGVCGLIAGNTIQFARRP